MLQSIERFTTNPGDMPVRIRLREGIQVWICCASCGSEGLVAQITEGEMGDSSLVKY